jgi:hypothetical protein
MSTVLCQNPPYFTFNQADLALVHSLPIDEFTNFVPIAFRKRDATGVTVQPLRCSYSREFGSLESACRHFQLMVKLDLVTIHPSLAGLPGEQIRNRFNPSPIVKHRICNADDKGL